MGQLRYKHLESFSSNEGYWSTTDCVLVAEDILKKTKAKSLLEIGFNIGYSSSVWLESGIEHLVAIDINEHRDMLKAFYAVNNYYKDKQIDLIVEDSKALETVDIEKILSYKFVPDMSFIDGEHSYEACLSDSYLSLDLGANWLVFDDVVEDGSNTIIKVVEELEEDRTIDIVSTYPMTWTGNGYVVLCKVNR